MRLLILTFTIFMSMFATSAYANDAMLACMQPNGLTLYTNKNVAGCALLKTPELSVVPSYNEQKHTSGTLEHAKILPMHTAPDASASQQLVPESEVVIKTCAMYKEWISINERTKGGFEYNDVDDTKKRLYLTKIFGSGFSPSMCKEQ